MKRRPLHIVAIATALIGAAFFTAAWDRHDAASSDRIAVCHAGWSKDIEAFNRQQAEQAIEFDRLSQIMVHLSSEVVLAQRAPKPQEKPSIPPAKPEPFHEYPYSTYSGQPCCARMDFFPPP